MDNSRKVYAAVDFGAGSGRVIAGIVTSSGIELKEIHRFANGPAYKDGTLCWESDRLFSEMIAGLSKMAGQGLFPESVAIDTWGVDFALIDKEGRLIGDTVCYRDARTEGMPEKFFGNITPEEYYGIAGIQIMPINTIFQLMAVPREQIEKADKLLFMPDYFAYRLTGVAVNELTIASTSGLLDAVTAEWSDRLIGLAGIPRSLFGRIARPGEVIGTLLPEWAEKTGLGQIPVVAAASHDTASAVHASGKDGSLFLSSGTWSLLGITLDAPVLSKEAFESGFTNERGADGKVTFLQNITGLWIFQQLIAGWKSRGIDTDYDRLLSLASESACDSIIDVDAREFMAPDDMEKAIADYCESHGIDVPCGVGQMTYCVLNSLAFRYGKAVDALGKICGVRPADIRIFGGGSRNALLSELTQKHTGLNVINGHVEATAVGNIMIQIR